MRSCPNLFFSWNTLLVQTFLAMLHQNFRAHKFPIDIGRRYVPKVVNMLLSSCKKLGSRAKTARCVLEFDKNVCHQFWCGKWCLHFWPNISIHGCVARLSKSLLRWNLTTLHTYIHCVSARCWHAQVRANCRSIEQATRTMQPIKKHVTIGLRARCTSR